MYNQHLTLNKKYASGNLDVEFDQANWYISHTWNKDSIHYQNY